MPSTVRARSDNTGHTEWVDGRAHQIGFTTTFTPNQVVSPNRVGERSIDWTNMQEGKSDEAVTYAAVTARSFHPGIVNVSTMDGPLAPSPTTSTDGSGNRSQPAKGARKPIGTDRSPLAVRNHHPEFQQVFISARF